MKNSMSQILLQMTVKNALKSIKEDPERGTRNLVDMALQFSEGRFQPVFFNAVQTMLQNEKSPYYDLVRNTVSHTDIKRLYTFGMNLGYHGCTVGARRIRDNEKKLNCNIPWTISAQLDMDQFKEKEPQYQAMIRDGESLGIYTWMLFCPEQPWKALTLVEEHPDSAFCLFCNPEDMNPHFLDEAGNYYNLMLVLRYEENAPDKYALLRERNLLYSAWYPYGQKDIEAIINGDLFYGIQQRYPAFTVLLPKQDCPNVCRQLAFQTVTQARKEQRYSTILWDFYGDNRYIDTIISNDACSVCFGKTGDLYSLDGKPAPKRHNLFQNELTDILISACPKK
ncbi:MAG: hypothetical protein Q4C50_03050 [Eubacteriales bacterium]|nr:hypothetical protein [Eubacteriales bacterium]